MNQTSNLNAIITDKLWNMSDFFNCTEDDNLSYFTMSVVVAVLAILVSLYVNQRSKIPSRYQLPPIAPTSFLDSLRATTAGQIAWFLRDICSRMGRICRLRFLIPGKIVFVSADAILNREILTDSETQKSPTLKKFNQITAGVSQFFTSNGYRFYHARKAMAPAFANTHIKRMDQVTISKTEEWIKTKLQSMVDNGETIDINSEMVDLTLSIILEAAFEYDMSTEEKELLMECVHVTLSTFIFPNPFKMMFWWLFPSIWNAHRKAEQLMSIARNIITAHRQNNNPTKGTVIDLIVNNPNYNNDDERAADVVDLIIAGHETSANSMTFLLLELAKNPKDQYQLQQELRELSVEERNNGGSEHLKNCIKDAMRLRPVTAPGPIRVVGRDFIVPATTSTDDSKKTNGYKKEKDYYIPNGSLVFMPTIALVHNPQYFDNPLQFQPSRWETPTESMKTAFMPFSLGKRNCLGQSLANSEMQSILSRVCLQYNFELVDQGTTGFFITMKPIGVQLKATKI